MLGYYTLVWCNSCWQQQGEPTEGAGRELVVPRHHGVVLEEPVVLGDDGLHHPGQAAPDTARERSLRHSQGDTVPDIERVVHRLILPDDVRGDHDRKVTAR